MYTLFKIRVDDPNSGPASKKRQNSVGADLNIQDKQDGGSKILTLKIEPDQIISTGSMVSHGHSKYSSNLAIIIFECGNSIVIRY